MFIRYNFLISNERQLLPIHGKNGEYYVYVYFDKTVPFYVGKGKNKRMFDHLNSVLNNTYHNDKNKHKINKIKKIISNGRLPIIYKIYDNLTEIEALTKEMELINCYDNVFSERKILTNIVRSLGQNGGSDTLSNHPNKEEICKKISETIKAKGLSKGKNNPCWGLFGEDHPAFGHKKTPQWLENIRKSAKNKDNKGENNPRFNDHRNYEEIHGIEKATLLKKEQSESRKGFKNNNSKCWKFTNPEGDIFIICGECKSFCEEKEISMITLKRNLGKSVHYTLLNNIKFPKTEGWKLEEV